jgi:hypothetical protein
VLCYGFLITTKSGIKNAPIEKSRYFCQKTMNGMEDGRRNRDQDRRLLNPGKIHGSGPLLLMSVNSNIGITAKVWKFVGQADTNITLQVLYFPSYWSFVGQADTNITLQVLYFPSYLSFL